MAARRALNPRPKECKKAALTPAPPFAFQDSTHLAKDIGHDPVIPANALFVGLAAQICVFPGLRLDKLTQTFDLAFARS